MMERLPDALAPLAAYRQFIVYVLVPSVDRPGKTDKKPVNWQTGRVDRGAHIMTDAPTAIAAAARLGSQYGVGFEITEQDPFWFLDIDGCWQPIDPADPEGPHDWTTLSKQLIAAFPGAAVEVSSSGKGLHIIASGRAPEHAKKNKPYDLEFYTEKRFVALTGAHARGSASVDFSHLLPSLVAQFFPPGAGGTEWGDDWTDGPCDGWNGPTDDDQLLDRALRSNNARSAFAGKAAFRDLFERNVDVLARTYTDVGTSGVPYGESEADAALAQLLAWWTGKDCERIERLMRRSALVRAKWDRGGDSYLQRTIKKACAQCTAVLTDKEPEPLANAPTVAAPSTPAKGETAQATAVTGSTILGIQEQIDLFKGCVYVYDANRVLVPGGMLLKQDQFKVMYGGYVMPLDYANERSTRDAYESFTQSQAYRSPRADATCFKPDRAPGEIIHDAGRSRVNVWWPVEVPRQVGDVTPFLAHMAKLLPDARDREILLSYMCACVQYKGYKIKWAPLLQGVEGNGKTLLTRCVAEAVGRRYVHWPKASKLAKEFNAWMLNKLFYGVEDIYVPGNRREIIEELKPMITGEDLEIEAKGVDQVSKDVCGNFMFNSNHKDAVAKTRNDRRFSVFYTAQQSAEDLVRDGMTGTYFNDLFAWLDNGGFAIVSELLHTRPILDEFNPTTRCQVAPITSTTEEVIAENRGNIEQEILEAIAQGSQGFAGGYVSSLFLGHLLEGLRASHKIAHNKRRELMAGLGYISHPGLPDGRLNNPVMPDGGKPKLYIRKDHADRHLTDASEIAKAYTAAQTVSMPGVTQ